MRRHRKLRPLPPVQVGMHQVAITAGAVVAEFVGVGVTNVSRLYKRVTSLSRVIKS
jgi:hypothetical protein